MAAHLAAGRSAQMRGADLARSRHDMNSQETKTNEQLACSRTPLL